MRKFKVLVEKDDEGSYYGEAIDLPGCYTQGDTLKEFKEHMKEAIELYLETATDLDIPKKKFAAVKEVVVNA